MPPLHSGDSSPISDNAPGRRRSMTSKRSPSDRTLGIITALAGLIMLLTSMSGVGPANGETPAERCARETSAYNAAWATSWAAGHAGSSPADAPPPPVPYVCVERQDPTTTPTAPTTTAPGLPQVTDTGSGPQVGAHAPTDIPPPGSAPIVPVVPRAGSASQQPSVAAPADPTAEPADVLRRGETLQLPGRHQVSYSETVDKWNDMGPNEQSACKSNPYDCNRSRNNNDQGAAWELSEAEFPGDQESTKADAARHCIWQGLTTESANMSFAEAMAEAHEIDSPSPIAGSKEMDLYNNNTGRQVGRDNEGNRAEIISQCLRLAHEAKPWDPIGNKVPESHSNDLIYISNKQPMDKCAIAIGCY